MINQKNSIAVIGMAGTFPEASNISEFYRNLRAGRDSIKQLSLGRICNSSLPYSKDYQVRGFLDRIDLFDHKFFNISLREAEQMDPTQRILLEKTCEAIWNAGYSLKEFEDTNTAVYLGGDPYADYPEVIENFDATIYSGNLHAMLCGRISYTLNLHGPSMMIDTSCSSSLVAVHEACQKLIHGEVDYAIAGGLFIITSFPEKARGDADMGINSPDGRSKTFDAAANGTGGGEGGGLVVLKRLEDAERDGDNILAIIRGSAINHGGRRSNGITAPSPAAQTELLIKAWSSAGINPEEISYLEVHGTGTKLGDPIEFKGITDAFNHFTEKKKFCALSAVKTNIGHLNNGAGIAGLIKCILSLNNQEIFPSLHFHQPSPFIDFENSAAYVNTRLVKWPAEKDERKCAVSSFGMSGTNVHVVVEESCL
jgi:acyl transferase domain-containing protein